MNRIHVLDCTLRDGGYCNEWRFGSDNIRKIIDGLVKADIDIIECGFLTDQICHDSEISKFVSIDDIKAILPKQRTGNMFVAMLNFGEYDAKDLPDCDGVSIQGLRIAFHKRDRKEAIKLDFPMTCCYYI